MNFPIKQYYKTGLVFPLAICLGLLIIAVSLTIVYFMRPCYKRSFTSFVLFPWLVFVVNVIILMPTLRHTVHLLTERESDAVCLTGKVASINEDYGSLHYPSFTEGEKYSKASIIIIDNEEYYIMSRGELKKGDVIIISYLPDSKIILSWEYSEDSSG